jgi:hypothetical protein
MTIMDYQFFILLAPTLALVIYAVIDHIKHGGAHG